MSRFAGFAVRDLAIGALTALAWRADRRARGKSAAIGVAAGVLTGVSGFLVHEWGHLAGTKLAGGVAEAPKHLTSPFLFFFDTEKSDRRAFLAMSAGGYLGTAVATLGIVALAPRDRTSGRVALGLTALGALVTVVAEMPTTMRVWRGEPMPTGGVFAGNAAAGLDPAL